VHGDGGNLTGAGAVSLLLLLADLERGDAQAGQGEGRLRCLGLDLAAEKLAADPLELLTDVQLCGVQVDELPGESEYLAFAQAQDQDQDKGGVQGLARMPGRLQEPFLPLYGIERIGQRPSDPLASRGPRADDRLDRLQQLHPVAPQAEICVSVLA